MSYSFQKNPLSLMEPPENGLIHEYGAPIPKSLKPITVKQVQSLQENSKWLSPDKNFSTSHGKSDKKSKPVKTSSSSCEKSDLSDNARNRRRRYVKLDVVKSDTTRYDDENKENIRPGASNSIKKAAHLKSEEESNPRKRYTERFSRKNFV